jgi:hypothetical protein
VQLAKRRQRIVHHADLPDGNASEVLPWSMADEWSLIMWCATVPAFYCLLRSELHPNDAMLRKTYELHRTALDQIVEFGHALKAMGDCPSTNGNDLITRAQKIFCSVQQVLTTVTQANSLLTAIDSQTRSTEELSEKASR